MLEIPGVEWEAGEAEKPSSRAITDHGHDFFEALSALQKSVRRNKEADALYWAYQLSGFNPVAMWNRLKVMASEEVGLASPETVLLVRALYDNWQDVGKGNPGEGGLFLAHAVVALCRAKKNSLAVNAACIMKVLPKREVPDYALDRHTYRGRNMGRGWDHFFDIGAHRENRDETIPDIYAEHVRKNIEKIAK
jgi:replication-associated recombination protein RarA